MLSDETQNQSSDDQQSARKLSLMKGRPPAEVAGYRFIGFIGSGAYGEVWSAINEKTGRSVAIKFYTRGSKSGVKMLAQEVEKLAVLSNDSYVIGLLDVGWEADPPYYIMDFIESGSLEDRLKGGGTLSVNESVQLFQEIAIGMASLHDKGILHCDLKPGNVLLDQNGKPRVCDFGQSRLSSEQNSSLGTLFYMAPEQADTAAIPDASWDVYGLGALLYSMLVGHPPRYSDSSIRTIESGKNVPDRLRAYQELFHGASVPSEHRKISGVDRQLGELIDKCIAADSKHRFKNIQSVLLALRQREMIKARRPVIILGLIAPFILMTFMAAVGAVAFQNSYQDAQTAVLRKAALENKFAGNFAARGAASNLNEYFRAVRQLSEDVEFRKDFSNLINDTEMTDLRSQIAYPDLNDEGLENASDSLDSIRIRLAENDDVRKMEAILRSRLTDQDDQYPSNVDSWFVCDRWGNQVASVFAGRKENTTRGKNFSYRSYFTGNYDDLKKTDPSLSSNAGLSTAMRASLNDRKIISREHLSSGFLSTQTDGLKVAFSVPLEIDGNVMGVVALTINLGDIAEFDLKETDVESAAVTNGDIESHYMMLVDTRGSSETEQDVQEALILEHPAMEQVWQNSDGKELDIGLAKVSLPKSRDPLLFNSLRYGDAAIRAEVPFAGSQGEFQFKAIIERIPLGELLVGTRKSELPDTVEGIEVWAVLNYENELTVVDQLASKLAKLGAMAGLGGFVFVIGMLLFVKRLLAESRKKLTWSFEPDRTEYNATVSYKAKIDD
ncbi:protein kinase [Mariniblastus sp.]|nr:protein kinase [bacterium]MDC3223853.1 protein kinase [Mariniblastus sp.]